MKLSLNVGLLMLVIQVSWIPPGMTKFHKDTRVFHHPLPDDSYFGFSTTYQPDIKRLIISAPKADNIGKIFSCDINSVACSELPSNITRASDKYLHNYWLGATVKAGPDYFLTCAPLSVEIINKRRFGAVSTCFKVTSSGYVTMPSISDEDRNKLTTGLVEQSMDSFGWSIDIAKNEHYLFGGPGMFSGRTMDVDSEKLMSAQAIIGKKYNKNMFNFGYGVAAGFFFNDKQLYAIGSPYGWNGNGMVVILTTSHRKLQFLQEDNSIGSMYGAVLCSVRLADDTDTLFVGAPTQSDSFDYNTGAVYVYQKTDRISRLKFVRKIQGLKIGGQFGSAIADIGDMNGDNINDIAISAPYENDGVGAVYLYCGASIADKSITTLTPLQKFEASDVRNFGLSLAVLNDYDENGCNELAIGAPGNGKVTLYNCITEIPITLEARFPPLKKRIDLTRFTFKSCFTVTYPPKLKKITGSVQINIEITHEKANLAHPADDAKYVVPLDIKKTTYCRDVEVSTPPGGNYNHAISYSMSAKLTEDAETLPFDRFRFMFSDRSQLIKKGAVRAANCINDDECIPKLSATITASERLTHLRYTIGSSKFETFTLTVNNEGDTAYEMCLKGRLEGAEIYQTPECPHDEKQFTCKPQQALQNGKNLTLGTFVMKMDKLTSENLNVTINVELYDDCDNQTQYQDIALIIPLFSSTDFAIKGNTDIDDTVNMTKDDIHYLGKTISHFYWIHNTGPTTWVGLKYTLTFMKKPYIDESVQSDYVEFAARSSIECSVMPSINKDEAKVTCSIDKLYGATRKQITVPIHILAGKLESLLDGKNETVITHCSLEFGSESIEASITSTLTEGIVSVSLWIIFAACFVGLLIVLLFILILIECGCMRRKNKEMLKALKKDVRRQTIRRSMMQSEERRRLVEETDEPTCSINHPEDPTKEVRFHTVKESHLQENIKSDNEQKSNPMLKELNERLTRNK